MTRYAIYYIDRYGEKVGVLLNSKSKDNALKRFKSLYGEYTIVKVIKL